ncbi:hypothetical protein [Alloacidobacterium sp.]|uniref:hypothetical protein n=1 Tax=Alloacidobacterium sp. TaxID=2951999 RepID=UPI002D620172|nr:hypothetical protein [Alloacidobacterium sp.]HYK34685.1 hypothetical protein [Alloacidobacterium sp.]
MPAAIIGTEVEKVSHFFLDTLFVELYTFVNCSICCCSTRIGRIDNYGNQESSKEASEEGSEESCKEEVSKETRQH